MLKILTSLFLSTFLIAGCTPGNNTMGSTVAGAALGGAGSAALFHGSTRPEAIIAGTVVGGVAGNLVGQNMDKQQVSQQQSAGPMIIHDHEHYYDNPHNCKRYTQTIYINGRPKQTSGIACQYRDGSWHVIQ